MNKIFRDIRFRVNRAKSLSLMSRRSTEEIFDMKNKIQELFLKADREEKPTLVVKAQLDILKWVLNDTSI